MHCPPTTGHPMSRKSRTRPLRLVRATSEAPRPSPSSSPTTRTTTRKSPSPRPIFIVAVAAVSRSLAAPRHLRRTAPSDSHYCNAVAFRRFVLAPLPQESSALHPPANLPRPANSHPLANSPSPSSVDSSRRRCTSESEIDSICTQTEVTPYMNLMIGEIILTDASSRRRDMKRLLQMKNLTVIAQHMARTTSPIFHAMSIWQSRRWMSRSCHCWRQWRRTTKTNDERTILHAVSLVFVV